MCLPCMALNSLVGPTIVYKSISRYFVQTDKRLVSKEPVVLHQWGYETLNFLIKQVGLS